MTAYHVTTPLEYVVAGLRNAAVFIMGWGFAADWELWKLFASFMGPWLAAAAIDVWSLPRVRTIAGGRQHGPAPLDNTSDPPQYRVK